MNNIKAINCFSSQKKTKLKISQENIKISQEFFQSSITIYIKISKLCHAIMQSDMIYRYNAVSMNNRKAIKCFPNRKKPSSILFGIMKL